MEGIVGARHKHILLGVAAVALAALPVIYTIFRRTLKHQRNQRQYPSQDFVLAAGAIPFQFDALGAPRRVLLAHHAPLDAWLLSKGRKDEGEDLATTAVREVFEETGYSCRLYPVPRLPTCAPLPAELAGTEVQSQAARIAKNSTEPFMLTFRLIEFGMVKLIFWYIGIVDVPYEEGINAEESTHTQPGSHQLAEGFDQVRLFDIEEAIEKLAFEGDRDLVRAAVSILSTAS